MRALVLAASLLLMGCPESVPGPVEAESTSAVVVPNDGFVVWVEAGTLAASPAPEKAPGGVTAWLSGLSEAGKGPLAILNLRDSKDPEFGDLAAVTTQIPIADFQVPTVAQVEEAMEFITGQLAAGRTVVVHCQGGCGRTGTILALYLRQLRGISGPEALSELRALKPCFVETKGQEEFINSYDFDAL
jgi:atypical dual specificity phosphatase